jgi:putative ABC transport system ATP-binding protein
MSSGKLFPAGSPYPALKLSPNTTSALRVCANAGARASAEIKIHLRIAFICDLPTIIEEVPNASILAARNLTKSLDSGSHRVEILRGIDLEIPAGQFVAIMGASGSGKSTLLGLLAGLDTPTSGTIVIDGVDITGLSEDKLALVRGRKIGFVFQSYQLLPTLTAEENVLLPHELGGGDVSAGVARARSLLESVGLADRLDHYPVQLSGGEQQRVALARAFMVKPPVLMADEPTGNLDSVNGAHVLDLLISLNQREGTTMVLVTHDMALAERADRIVTLRDGQIVSDEVRELARS